MGLRSVDDPSTHEGEAAVSDFVALTDDVVVGVFQNTYRGYRREDFELLWEFSFKHSPAEDPTEIRAPLGEELVVGCSRKGKLERRCLRSGELLQAATLGEPLTAFAVCGDRLVGVDKKKRHLIAFELLGENLSSEVWRKAIKGRPEQLKGTLRHVVVEDEALYRVSDGTKAWAEELWNVVASEGDLLQVGGSQVELYNAENGEVRWSWALDTDGVVNCAHAGASAVFLAHSVRKLTKTETSTSVAVTHVFKGLDRATGEVLFERPFEERGTPTPGKQPKWSCAFASDVIYVMAPDDASSWVTALDAKSGELLWERQLPGFASGRLLLPSEGALTVLDLSVGAMGFGSKASVQATLRRTRFTASQR